MIGISVSLVVQVSLMDFSRRFWLSEAVQNLIPFGFVNATIFNRYLPFSCPLRYFRY